MKLTCASCKGEFVVPRTWIVKGRVVSDYSMVRCMDCQRVTYTLVPAPKEATS